MDTKHRILDEALTLFSQKGYYKNKQAIFDAIIDEMNRR